MPNMIDRYRYWFEYEKDSHAKVLESLEAVPEEQRCSTAVTDFVFWTREAL